MNKPTTAASPIPAVLLPFRVTAQPDEQSCGPSCLHGIYGYYDDDIDLATVIEQVNMLPGGGTLAVMLALHGMARGYDATIYTCNLQLFDPSWFDPGAGPVQDKLRASMAARNQPRHASACKAYLQFLDAGGHLRLDDPSASLIASLLAEGHPLIAGLSATWLYRTAREMPDGKSDDIAGDPTGHFVVVHGINPKTGIAHVADPWLHRPTYSSRHYQVPIDRLVAAILLGALTWDAKLLVLRPPTGK